MNKNKYTAVRRLQFCAGHRVHKHESKCNNMHGHNYVLFIHARTRLGLEELDALGRVVDFSVLKEIMGGWIDKFWDHGFICFGGDQEVLKTLHNVKDQKTYILGNNPTAENMADHLLHVVCPGLFKGQSIEIFKVVLWETENCYAEVELPAGMGLPDPAQTELPL